jgi:hypothetical protein
MPAPDRALANQADASLGQYVAGRIHEDFMPMASQCYESAVAQSPGLRGRVSLRFTIVGDRRVGAVVDSADVDESTDIANPSFLECLKQSVMTVNFAAPPEGTQQVSAVFSMRFAPDGEAN